jgi:hypothetical protein
MHLETKESCNKADRGYSISYRKKGKCSRKRQGGLPLSKAMMKIGRRERRIKMDGTMKLIIQVKQLLKPMAPVMTMLMMIRDDV